MSKGKKGMPSINGGGTSPQKAIRFTDVQLADVERFAQADGIKASVFIRNAVERELNRLRRKEAKG